MNKLSHRPQKNVVSTACATGQDRLDQAEVCREQARDAARLHRFAAARGLFSTAVALYQEAMASGLHDEAAERLRQLQIEIATYSELSRSMGRPLLMHGAHPASADRSKGDFTLLTR